jgi:hypothetical protein
MVYLTGFIVGTTTHILDIVNLGFLGYTHAPMPINIYWTSLTFINPLAILLLLINPCIGLFLVMGIMATDVSINLGHAVYTYFTTGELYFSRLLFQIFFGIFVFITAPVLLKIFRKNNRNY